MSDHDTNDDRPCKDCGALGWYGWWRKLGWKESGGSFRCRCHPCYNASIRKRYKAANPRGPQGLRGPRGPKFGPPKPRPTVTCPECGVEHVRSNQSLRCPECVDRLNAERRSYSEARRRKAYRDGDKDIHWEALGHRDKWRCHICGGNVARRAGTAMVMDGATVDHLVPIAAGGDHTWSNVALAHRSCNISRGARGSAQLRLVG